MQIELKNINKVYPNGVQAVYDFNLSIKSGEFVVLVGPSGCGKSTTLRMVAGLEEITRGDFLMDDRKMNELAPKDRNIAMVFQNYALYAHMTVYHNMAFSLSLRKENSDYIHERVLWAADILGLTPYLNRKPAHLSGGQRQRVAVGRAMVRNPKIFLFDEPLSNLDAKLRESMRKELKLLHHRLKTTILYVTHDQTEALTLADKIVIMKDGYIQQVGTPVEIYQDPANVFVAEFIGTPSMNLVEATVISDRELKIGKKIYQFKTNKKALDDYIGKKIVFGVRAENIVITKGKEYIISQYELLGSSGLVYFDLEGHQFIAKSHARNIYQSEDEIGIDFDMEKVYLFDQTTQERIYF
ncbi:putative ABC transporter subunit, ATP-binding [Alteracholeplasma palmae J233]|uniref:Putative ABC transporter subunit, ATP-binding n=1 Tax=Alteracholeplasma palmae (strain ATCC 49389 / J233) TaxID=1318466 RepID=U4KKG3_ALTPJ|nr:sn-glycerol-3-phosphate ABC transporter ATP-binding protein UgpC [Alteracholeplasma palmae]CCV64219.1 putative ABC transporter subunit, ATP-binding [Alteracholeplasma palmae J233]